jgi:hypothetical protein
MANIDKTRVWANDETRVSEPTTILQDAGYAPLEQPYNEHHNWIWNSRDKKLNHLLGERNLGQSHAAGISKADQVAGRFEFDGVNRIPGGQDWLHPYSSLNKYQFPAGFQPTCMAPAWDYTLDRPVVYVGCAGLNTGIYSVRNADDGTIAVEFIPLTFDEGGEFPEAIASEGDAFYILTAGKASTNYGIYRFSANPTSPTKAWSTVETSSLFGPAGLGRNALIVADDTWVAFPCTGVAPGSNTLVRMVRKSDGAAANSGDGNAGGYVSSFRASPNICSDGIRLHFAIEQLLSPATERILIGTADIANLAQATDGGGSPVVVKQIDGTEGLGCGSLIWDGALVHVLTAKGTVASLYPDGNVYRTDSEPTWEFANAFQPQSETDHPSMCFDGLNAWVLLELDGIANDANAFISPLRVGDQSVDLISTQVLQSPDQAEIMIGWPKPGTSQTYDTKMVYSDNALWILPRIKSSPIGLDLLRLPNLAARR